MDPSEGFRISFHDPVEQSNVGNTAIVASPGMQYFIQLAQQEVSWSDLFFCTGSEITTETLFSILDPNFHPCSSYPPTRHAFWRLPMVMVTARRALHTAIPTVSMIASIYLSRILVVVFPSPPGAEVSSILYVEFPQTFFCVAWSAISGWIPAFT